MHIIEPAWPAPSHIKAFTTTRLSFGSLAQTAETFATHLKTTFNLPTKPLWIKQTHSATALPIDAQHEGKEADALFTSHVNEICAVRTADCLPLLVCNKAGTHVAAIHAGWRGLAKGIIEATLTSLQLPMDSLLIWLGPAIGPKQFEVGSDVYDAFLCQSEDFAAGFIKQNNEKWLANIYTLAKIKLNQLGVYAIYGDNYCTYTQNELFFSYRRDKTNPGRMASLIWIDGNII